MFCDIHSHILWGIDDGAQTREQSLAMLQKACDDGIRHVIATPHFIPGRYEITTDLVYDRVKDVNSLAQEQGLDIRVYPGCEVSVDTLSFNLLSEHKIPTLCGTPYVLLELCEVYTAETIMNMVDTAIDMQYIPVIAHAERCISYKLGMCFIQKLVDRGALIQINASSVKSPYTIRPQRRFINNLLSNQLVFAISSDCHSDSLRPPTLSATADLLQKFLGKTEAEKLLWSNPLKIIKSSPLWKG